MLEYNGLYQVCDIVARFGTIADFDTALGVSQGYAQRIFAARVWNWVLFLHRLPSVRLRKLASLPCSSSLYYWSKWLRSSRFLSQKSTLSVSDCRTPFMRFQENATKKTDHDLHWRDSYVLQAFGFFVLWKWPLLILCVSFVKREKPSHRSSHRSFSRHRAYVYSTVLAATRWWWEGGIKKSKINYNSMLTIVSEILQLCDLYMPAPIQSRINSNKSQPQKHCAVWFVLPEFQQSHQWVACNLGVM